MIEHTTTHTVPTTHVSLYTKRRGLSQNFPRNPRSHSKSKGTQLKLVSFSPSHSVPPSVSLLSARCLSAIFGQAPPLVDVTRKTASPSLSGAKGVIRIPQGEGVWASGWKRYYRVSQHQQQPDSSVSNEEENAPGKNFLVVFSSVCATCIFIMRIY